MTFVVQQANSRVPFNFHQYNRLLFGSFDNPNPSLTASALIATRPTDDCPCAIEG
jgi:hypothetical protein